LILQQRRWYTFGRLNFSSGVDFVLNLLLKILNGILRLLVDLVDIINPLCQEIIRLLLTKKNLFHTEIARAWNWKLDIFKMWVDIGLIINELIFSRALQGVHTVQSINILHLGSFSINLSYNFSNFLRFLTWLMERN
jgi:hypothetical protein